MRNLVLTIWTQFPPSHSKKERGGEKKERERKERRKRRKKGRKKGRKKERRKEEKNKGVRREKPGIEKEKEIMKFVNRTYACLY